ncbi:hypothetical protein [Streptomyces antimicrobicus]|uniref:CENP-V/GFA domain-containing protein n=1 Tax=Streptomyces antimicrobicus TaxID=2883108 RepID=A0ABS8BBE2_9ACTN|nr:hypothetical protein [Streptomyces antimicrobicus]MCB5181934.1 hypothetical protein [Streptomyces antimicrobicus]
MGDHVHIRLKDGMEVSAAGELVETYHCPCGSTWTKIYPVEGREPYTVQGP